MSKVITTEDIHPLSEFRANTAAFVKRVQSTKRPLVLTQHGRSTAVLLDAGEYDSLIEQVELLRDVQMAEKQLAEGKGLTQSKAKAQVHARLRQ